MQKKTVEGRPRMVREYKSTYAVSYHDDDHDARHAQRASHEHGVHVDHGQRAAPRDDQPHDCHQEAVQPPASQRIRT